jgi:protein O-mannosyl-transferase
MQRHLKTVFTVGSLLILGFLCFQKILRFGYVTYDDATHLYKNPFFSPLNVKSLARFWSAPLEHLYVPVTYTAWALGVGEDWEKSAKIFHAMNLTLHLLNGALVFAILRHFVDSRSARFLGAAVFLFHPIQVEAVAWISALKDVLSAFWALLSVELFLRWTKSPNRKLEAGVILFFLLALLSKPWAIVLPLIWWILDKRALRFAAAAIFPILLVGVMTMREQPSGEIAHRVEWYLHPKVMLDSFTFYLLKIVQPLGFTINYGRNPEIAAQSQLYLYGALVTSLLWIFFRQEPFLKRAFLLGLGIFLVVILPTSGIIPFFYQKYSTVADRFVYFGLLGPALFVALLAQWKNTVWTRLILGSLLVFCGLSSHFLLKHWASDLDLVARMARVAPSADHSFNLAQMISYGMEGQSSVPGLLTSTPRPPRTELEKKYWLSAIEGNYREAIWMRPSFAEAYNGLGMVQAQQGKLIEAVASFRETLKLQPNFALAWHNLGQAYEALGKNQWAYESYAKAIELDPKAALARLRLEDLLKRDRGIKSVSQLQYR